MGMNYPTARDEQAAYWYLKLQEPQVSADDISALANTSLVVVWHFLGESAPSKTTWS